jgi:hypothetical protein
MLLASCIPWMFEHGGEVLLAGITTFFAIFVGAFAWTAWRKR